MIPRARWILNTHLIIWFGARGRKKSASKVSERPDLNSAAQGLFHPTWYFLPTCPKILHGCQWVKHPQKSQFLGRVLLPQGRAGTWPPLEPPPWQHLPPFCDSISFFACSRMFLMASSEPVSGVLIRGVMLPDQRGRITALSPALVLQAPLVCQEVFTAPHVQLFLGMLV